MKESSAAVIRYLEQLPIISSVKKLVMDNGPQFCSKSFENFAATRGITIVHSTPYHPAGNGLAERKIRDLKQYVSMYPQFKGGWKSCLEAAVKHANRSHSSGIGCSPHFKAFGEVALYPDDAALNISKDMVKESPYSLSQLEKYRTRMKNNFLQKFLDFSLSPHIFFS